MNNLLLQYSVDLKDASLNNTDIINTATALSKTIRNCKNRTYCKSI